MQSLSQILAQTVRSLPERIFLRDATQTLSYAQFYAQTARLAHVLAARGVAKGDIVGLYLPSQAMMGVAFWACQRLGAIPAPVSAMFRHAELRKIIDKTQMKALIADQSTWPYFSEIRGEFSGLACCLVAGTGAGNDDLLDLMAAAPADFADEPVDPQDTACLFFTSGTTGTPKGTAQSHFAISSSWRDMFVSHRNRYGQEVYLCAVPLFTNFGLNVTFNLCLYGGGTIILHERWNTTEVLADIVRYRATYFGGTPTMYVYLVNDFEEGRHDLSSLRTCTTGGAPVPQPVIRRFEELSGARVTQVYGSTETCGQNVMEPTSGLRKAGSAGLPVGASRIRIVDEQDRALPVGEIGEVIIGGDCVAQGYWQDEEASREAFCADGWRSGDLGYLDEDGYLFIVDRKKDVIIAGGHNIYPLEIETQLYKHPAVAVCAVVGIPDDTKGEIPVAVVVRKQGADCDAAALLLWCRDHLAAYKVPRRIEFIDQMPVEAAKIRKRDLVLALKADDLTQYRVPA